jgi:glyoxylase-like metal-dependent hydrolase (beta-lactamase superfamily II)
MKPSTRRAPPWLILLCLTGLHCADSARPDAPPVSQDPLEKAASALGGAQALRSLTSQRIAATGKRTEHAQGFRPGAPQPLAQLTSLAVHDLENDRLRIDWTRGPNEPYYFSTAYAEVIVGARGYVTERDGLNAAGPGAMLANRVAAVRKAQRLVSPHLLLRQALLRGSARQLPDTQVGGQPHHVLELEEVAHPLRLFIDTETGLPSRLETLEDDPVWGDSLLEVTFEDWREVGSFRAPFKVMLRQAGRELLLEERTEVAFNTPVDDTALVIPPAYMTLADPEGAARGESRSSWYNRWLALNFNLDFNFGQSVQVTDVAPDVIHLTGAFHHSLAVKMAGSIVVLDAPLDDARARTLLTAVKARWPGLPVSHLLLSHFHWDHAGGARAFVAEGATIITAESNRDFLQALVSAPHSVVADTLAQRPAPLRALYVSDSAPVVLDDGGTQRVELRRVQTTHSQDMLVAWLPTSRLLFAIDLYSPNTAPPEGALPGSFGMWARELYLGIQSQGLDVERIIGAHGAGLSPLSQLKTHAGL